MRDTASRGARWMGSLLSDFCQVCRRLGMAPGFALLVTVIMAAGIGVSTGIFSIVRNVLLRSLPYRDPNAGAAGDGAENGSIRAFAEVTPRKWLRWLDTGGAKGGRIKRSTGTGNDSSGAFSYGPDL